MSLTVVIDTREKKPLVFPGIQTIGAALTHGDYAADRSRLVAAVERKGGTDYLECLTRRRDKFDDQLRRLRAGVTHPLLVAEILSPAVFARLRPGETYRGYERAVAGFLDAGFPTVYTGGPTESAEWVLRWLRRWNED